MTMVEKDVTTCDDFLTHVHEFLGSTMLAAPEDSPQLLHNHRFAGVTGPVIPRAGGHVHVLSANSDFFFNHFHQIEAETGPPIPVRDQNGKIIGHVHGFQEVSSCVFFHAHVFQAATLIEDPITMDTSMYDVNHDTEHDKEHDSKYDIKDDYDY